MNTIVHATARLCACPVDVALAHLSTAAGLARWNLGLWNCRETEPGVFTGVSLFDGASGQTYIVDEAELQVYQFDDEATAVKSFAVSVL